MAGVGAKLARASACVPAVRTWFVGRDIRPAHKPEGHQFPAAPPRPLQPDLVRPHDEHVAAEPDGDIAVAVRAPQPGGDLNQDRVAAPWPRVPLTSLK